MTTAFDRWVAEAIQDLGGDGAKYLREKSNVVSLTDWKNFRYNSPRQRTGLLRHHTMSPQAQAFHPKGAVGQHWKRLNLRVFAFLAAVGRLCSGIKCLNRHMGLDGFWRDGIARGCCSQDSRRIPSGAPVDRLHRCTDAMAPGSREAGQPSRGLTLLRPQPSTKKQS